MHALVKLSFMVAIVSFMIQMGLELPRDRLREATRHVGPLARGLLLMLVVSPLLALLVIRIFGVPRPTSTAILVTSVTGVLPLAPRSAGKAHGNVPYAIVLTGLLGAITMVSAPLTIASLVHYAGDITIPASSIIAQLLLLQLVPLLVGVALAGRSFAPRLAHVLGIANVVGLASVVLFAVLPQLPHLRMLGWRDVIAISVLSAALALGGLLIGGPGLERKQTLATFANMPNVALAMLIVTAAGAAASPLLPTAVSAVFLFRVLFGALFRVFRSKRQHSTSTSTSTSSDAHA